MPKESPSKFDIKQLEDIATLKADMRTVKSDIKDVKTKIERFIETADKKYATKEEVKTISKQVTSNTNRLFTLSKEVAQWGVLIALITKSIGMW